MKQLFCLTYQHFHVVHNQRAKLGQLPGLFQNLAPGHCNILFHFPKGANIEIDAHYQIGAQCFHPRWYLGQIGPFRLIELADEGVYEIQGVLSAKLPSL